MRTLYTLVAAAGFLVVAFGLQEQPIILEVPKHQSRCLRDVVSEEQNTVFHLEAKRTNKDAEVDAKIKIKTHIEIPGEGPEMDELSTEAGEPTPFEAGKKGGIAKFCFSNANDRDVWIMVQAIIGEKDVTSLRDLLDNALVVAADVKKGMKAIFDGEEQRKLDDERFRSGIRALASFTVLVLLSVSGWKIVLLNQFFRSKKLL